MGMWFVVQNEQNEVVISNSHRASMVNLISPRAFHRLFIIFVQVLMRLDKDLFENENRREKKNEINLQFYYFHFFIYSTVLRHEILLCLIRRREEGRKRRNAML
jgi:hypothetical protein